MSCNISCKQVEVRLYSIYMDDLRLHSNDIWYIVHIYIFIYSMGVPARLWGVPGFCWGGLLALLGSRGGPWEVVGRALGGSGRRWGVPGGAWGGPREAPPLGGDLGGSENACSFLRVSGGVVKTALATLGLKPVVPRWFAFWLGIDAAAAQSGVVAVMWPEKSGTDT